MSEAATAYQSPLFWPLQPWLQQLPGHPETRALHALTAAHPRFTADGRQVAFVPPQADGLSYEDRIALRGEVETRPDNWHDFFNALIWLAFPETKKAITAAHVRSMQAAGEARGTVRDALTHFDECGIVVLSSRPELLALLQGFAWKGLFVERREEVRAHMRFVVFGHATYDSLLKPFRGLTAKAIHYTVDEAWLAQTPEEQIPAVDRFLAADFSAGRHTRPRDLHPLPLLGIPGVTPESENPDYYDDTWQFRPARRPSN
jgi:hypothetical protein